MTLTKKKTLISFHNTKVLFQFITQINNVEVARNDDDL